MEQVEKQRRRNRIISLAAIALIAVVAVTVVVYSLSERGNAVPLPGYLDRCVIGTVLYHAHPNLAIVLNGSRFTIPTGVGITGNCNKPIHTHDATGALHVETNDDRNYKIVDFFLIWGNWENNAQRAIFNSTQLFGAHVVGGHTLTMTVNGNTDTSFQNYVIPRNAQSGTETCSASPCQTVDIVITYQ